LPSPAAGARRSRVAPTRAVVPDLEGIPDVALREALIRLGSRLSTR